MTGIIILAAGASARLGTPKQLLDFKGKHLIEHAADAALAVADGPVMVVLGGHANAIEAAIADRGVHCLVCEDWQEGMSASIRAGVLALKTAAPALDAAVLMLCDQPFADASLLQRLLAQRAATGKKIIASAYSDTLGAPMLIDSELFPDLLLLEGALGAKALLARYPDEVDAVAFPEGAIDVDTAADYERLTRGL